MTLGKQTLYADLRESATAVYRATTRGSTYVIGFHNDGKRRHVIVRTTTANNEVVIMRDSDPRIGVASLFDVPPSYWVGQSLQIATMTTSPIEAVAAETEPSALSAVGHDERSVAPANNPWARPGTPPTIVNPPGGMQWSTPAPGGMSDSPCIVPQGARGTSVAERTVDAGTKNVPSAPHPAPVPVAPSEPEIPYPLRHVQYVESCAQLLRSVVRRERIFFDIAGSPQQRDRLRAALDECATLLEQLRRRDR